MDKAYAVECVKEYAAKVRKEFDVRQIILFGSYAQDTAKEFSDIDVAVILETAPDDWWAAATKLFKLRRDIDLLIEPIILDEAHNRSGFLDEIRRTGEVIYSRE